MNNIYHLNDKAMNPPAADLVDPPAFAQWEEYPAGVRSCNAIITPTSKLSARMSALGPGLFSEDISLQIIDIDNRNGW